MGKKQGIVKGTTTNETSPLAPPKRKAAARMVDKGKEKMVETLALAAKRAKTVTSQASQKVKSTHLSDLAPSAQAREFKKKFKDKFIPGKSIREEDFEGYDIVECFDAMGWSNVLFCKPYYYPVLCRDFVANLTKKQDGEGYTSTVNGNNLEVTRQVVCDCFDLKEEGCEFEWVNLKKKNKAAKDEFFKMVALITGKELKNVRMQKQDTVTNASLVPQARVLQRIVKSCIIPRNSGQVVVNEKDVFVLYYLMTGAKKLSFSHIFLESLWEVSDKSFKKVLPYACLLSQLLEHLRVVKEPVKIINLKNEKEQFITQKTFFKEIVFGENGVLSFYGPEIKKAAAEVEEVEDSGDSESDTEPKQPAPTLVTLIRDFIARFERFEGRVESFMPTVLTRLDGLEAAIVDLASHRRTSDPGPSSQPT